LAVPRGILAIVGVGRKSTTKKSITGEFFRNPAEGNLNSNLSPNMKANNQVEVSSSMSALDDLRRAIESPRLPDKETVTNRSQGVRLTTMKEHVRYCQADYAWREAEDGKPANKAVHKTCFSCHAPAKDHDFIFTRYVP
jgi:hypothetical protein